MSNHTTLSEYNSNDIKKLIDLLEKEFRGRSKKNTTFLRDGESKAKFSNSSVDVDAEFKILEKKRKLFEDTQKMHKHYIRTMAEGIPIIGTLVKSIGRNTKIIEENMRGQSNAYKNAAKATEEYTYRVGQNSKDLYIVQKTLAEVQKKAEELAKLSENRSKIEERIYKNAKKVKIDGFGKLKTDMSNLGDMMAKTAKRLKQEKGSDAEPLLQEMVSDLKELSKIPSLVASIKSDLGKTELKNSIKKDKALAAIMKPVMDGFGEDLQQYPKAIKQFSDDVTDTFRGSFDTLLTIIEENISDIERAFDKLTDSLTDAGTVISASFGAVLKKEAEMTLKRQQLTGRMFSTSMRMEAIGMGVSEVELLTSIAENRYALRRLGQSEGFKGADDFIASKTFEEMRKAAIQMGYIGSEALKKIMDTVEVLRKVGADESAQAVSNALKFQKNLFKDLGITQERMAEFYAEMMSPENALRLLASGPGTGTFATQEAIHEEIAVRAKLARVLNQDLQVQQKRLQEQKNLAFGDPFAALEKSIYRQMLALQVGMSEKEAALIGEYTRGGGANIKNTKKREAAYLAFEKFQKAIAEKYLEAVKEETGEKYTLYPFISKADIPLIETLNLLMSTNGNIPNSIEEVMNSKLAKTQTSPKDMENPTMRIVRAVESIQGMLKSTIGVGAVAILTSIAGAVFKGYMARRLLGRMPIFSTAIEAAGSFMGYGGRRSAARAAAGSFMEYGGRGSATRAATGMARGAAVKGAVRSAAVRSVVGGIARGVAARGAIRLLAGLVAPEIVIPMLALEGLYHVGTYIKKKYDEINDIKIKKKRLETLDRLISTSFSESSETIKKLSEERNKISRELAAAGESTDTIESMPLFKKLKTPYDNINNRVNFLELMEYSRKPKSNLSKFLFGNNTGMVRMVEQGIIDFANSGMLSNTTVKDVDSLQKMVDYLKEDGVSELYGEKEAFEKIVDRLEQLIRVNEDDLNVNKQAALQAEIRFRGINEREDALKIDQIVRGTVQDMMQTATRRLELLGYDGSGLV